jgi:hypothetical protein
MVTKPGNKRLIIWGINVNGTFQPLTNQDRKGEILIKKDTFNIGSSNIYDIKHLASTMYNQNDLIIRENVSTSNKSQLVGSTVSGSGITISANPGRTYIKKGNNIILDSNVGAKMFDNSSHQLVNTPQQKYNYTHNGNNDRITKTLTATVATSIPNGAYCFVTMDFSNSELNGLGTGNTSAAIFRYRNGKLQQISSTSYTSFWHVYFLEMYLEGDAYGNIKFILYFNTLEKKNSGSGSLTLPATITNTIILT